MKTIRIIIIFLLAVFFSMIIYGKCFAATVDAASCSQDDVQTAIDSAIRGDTVKIPAGSCTWTSSLSITKSITLQGAGIGSTTFTRSIGITRTIGIGQPVFIILSQALDACVSTR